MSPERGADKTVSFPSLLFLSTHTQVHTPICTALGVQWFLLSLFQNRHLAFAALCRWVVSDTCTVQLPVSGTWVIICLLINQQPLGELEVIRGWLNIQRERETVVQLWVKCWMIITRDVRIVTVTRAAAKIKSIYSSCLTLNIQRQFPKAEQK